MDLLAAGLTVDKILEEYPHLTKVAIFAAITFAKNAVQREEIYPLVEKNGQIVFHSA